jgi:hypothetical protein
LHPNLGLFRLSLTHFVALNAGFPRSDLIPTKVIQEAAAASISATSLTYGDDSGPPLPSCLFILISSYAYAVFTL